MIKYLLQLGYLAYPLNWCVLIYDYLRIELCKFHYSCTITIFFNLVIKRFFGQVAIINNFCKKV